MAKRLQNSKKILGLIVCLFLTTVATKAQYCTPGISYHCTYGNYGMWINNFSTTGGVTNITNNNSTCGNASTSFTYYSNHKHAGIQGTTVNFSILCGHQYAQGVKIWVDYNGDGDYIDAGELVYNPTTTQAANATVTGSFVIPAAATPIVTRMRVRCVFSSTTFDPCNAQSYGETEDYAFEVIPSCVSKFTTDPTDQQACDGYDATFKVVTTSTDSVHWQIWNGTAWTFLGDDANYTGTNTKSLNVKGLTFAWNNLQYRAVAFNKADNCSVNSKPAKIIMVPSSRSSIVISPNPGLSVCDGDEVVVYSAWTNGGNAPKYQWQVNSKPLPGETDGSLKTKNLQNGDTVSCVFISSAVCVYPETSNEIIFEVNPLLQPAVQLNVQHDGGSAYTYTAVPVNGGNNPVYIWYRNNSIVSGVNGDTYTVTDMMPNQKVFVQMVSKEKCVNTGQRITTSEMFTAPVVGVNDIAGNISNLKLHPNPNSGQFSIMGKLANAAKQEVHITIANNIGQVVTQYDYTAENGMLNIPVNMGTAANGIYTANVTVDGATSHIRFVLAK